MQKYIDFFLRIWYNTFIMRIDKFLKVSRILKRRSVANTACDSERVYVNGKAVKPSHQLKIGDIIKIEFGTNTFEAVVKNLNERASKDEACELYEVHSENKRER